MKPTLQILILFMLFGLSSACEKSKDLPLVEGNYLIFGHYYGLCMGEECIETFKLTADNLYEDTNDSYNENDFNFVLLPESLFEQVRDLWDEIPSELLAEADQTFGCPDCADQGGLFIQYAAEGEVQTWRIDQNQGSVMVSRAGATNVASRSTRKRTCSLPSSASMLLSHAVTDPRSGAPARSSAP